MSKAIDMHVHLPTASFLDGAIKPFKVAAETFFRSTVPVREMDEVARLYEELDIVGVLLAWDAETATGLPPLTNDQDRILFGSDYPFIVPQRWLADFDSLEGFSPEVRKKILHDNAAKILKL